MATKCEFLLILGFIFIYGCSQSISDKIEDNAVLVQIPEINNPAPFRIKKNRSVRLRNFKGIEPVPKVLAMPDQVLVFHFNFPERKMTCEAYSHELEWIWSKDIPIGQGPGDVMGGIRFFYIRGKVFGMDYHQQRYSRFDSKMNYRGGGRMPNINSYSSITVDGHYYFWSGGRRNNEWPLYITRLGSNRSTKIAEFGPFPGNPYLKNKKKFIKKVFPDVIMFNHDKYLIFLNCKEYSIHRITFKGRIDMAIQVKTPIRRLTEQENKRDIALFNKKYYRGRIIRRKDEYYPIVQPVAMVVPLINGFVVLRRVNYDPYCTGSMEGDYFTWDLILKGKTQFPCFLSCKGHFGFNTQSLWNDGIYLVEEGNEDDDSDILSFWQVEE